MTLEVECIDRMYLNLYVPNSSTSRASWASSGATAADLRLLGAHGPDDQGLRGRHRTLREATRASTWSPSRRASARTTSPRSTWPSFEGDEGVLFVGKAQEKTTAFRTEKRTNPETGRPTPGSCGPPPWSTTTTSTASTRLRPLLHQVLLLLPLQRQALHQRQRVGQVPGGTGRHRLRAPRLVRLAPLIRPRSSSTGPEWSPASTGWPPSRRIYATTPSISSDCSAQDAA